MAGRYAKIFLFGSKFILGVFEFTDYKSSVKIFGFEMMDHNVNICFIGMKIFIRKLPRSVITDLQWYFEIKSGGSIMPEQYARIGLGQIS